MSNSEHTQEPLNSVKTPTKRKIVAGQTNPREMTVTLKLLARSEQCQTSLCARQGQLLVIKQASGAALQQLELEARALNALHDLPGVPRLLTHQHGLLERSYLDGLTLQAVRGDRTLPRRQISYWLQNLRNLLEEIHARGLWHGDVCPANVLIRPDQQVALLDWGGPDWGTPPYRRPELSGPEADRFALRQLCEELLGQSDPGDGPNRPLLIGREQELDLLVRAWRDCPFQESTWIGVRAPSGGGKTALLRELLWHAPFHAWGQGSTLSTPVSYVLFQSLWENSGWQLHGEDGPAWQQFRRTFEHHPSAGESPLAYAPLLLAEAWHALLTRLTQARPLLLIFDDVQWTDEPGQRLLEMLSSRPLPGLMVVLAWRSEEYTPTSALRLSHQIDLTPLSAQHVRQWASQEQVDLADAQASRVVDWTQGCPLLIAELLRQPHQLSFSPRVGWMLKDRVATAAPETLTILRRAALMGTAFEREPLGSAEPVDRALQWAEQQQLVLPNLRFSHDQVREALLEEMPLPEKQREHRQLAVFFQTRPSRVHACAFHYAQAGEELAAVPFALKAARLDRDRGQAFSSLYFYRIYCKNQNDLVVLEEFCQVLELMGYQDEAIGYLEAALLKALPVQRAKLLSRIAVHHQGAGRYGKARSLCRQTWKALGQAPPPQRAEIRQVIMFIEVETCHTQTDMLVTVSSLARRLPWVLQGVLKHPIFQANLVLVLGYQIPRLQLRRQRRSLLRQKFRRLDRLTWSRVLARLVTFRLRHREGRFAERILRYIVSELESQGSPWELGIVLLLLGYYASMRGDFLRLRQVSHKLHQLAEVCGHRGYRDVALNFETTASGARLSARRYTDPPPPASEYFFQFHRWVGRTQSLLRRGRPQEALRALPQRTSHVPFELAMVATWKATALRQAGDQTPRRWGAQRQHFYRQALQEIESVFALLGWGRLFEFQLRREKGLILLRLGRPAEGQQELRRSIQEAEAFGADYEEALSRLAWSRAGLEGAEQEAQRARQLLEKIGAYWELSDSSPVGLPLQEVGEIAREYLVSPTPTTQAELERWTSPHWCQQLSSVVRAAQAAQAEAHISLQLYEARNARWNAFLRHGPVSISRFAADGQLLEGKEDNPGLSLELENGERLVVHLPITYTELSPLTGLIQAEQAHQRARLDWIRQRFPGLTPILDDCDGSWPQELVALPWNRLDQKARLALRWIFLESQNNLRKYRPDSKATLEFDLEEDWLCVQLGAQGPIESSRSSKRKSFGLESMSFRAAMAGGHFQVNDHYHLSLRLPLSG